MVLGYSSVRTTAEVTQQLTKNKLCCSNPDIPQLYNVDTDDARSSANIYFSISPHRPPPRPPPAPALLFLPLQHIGIIPPLIALRLGNNRAWKLRRGIKTDVLQLLLPLWSIESAITSQLNPRLSLPPVENGQEQEVRELRSALGWGRVELGWGVGGGSLGAWSP